MATEGGEQAPEGDLPKEGDILADKYRIERVLGQGGMGVVVAAQHTTLRRKVAVKFLLPSAAKRGDATERFLREARAAVSIQSEHVARVTDVGTLATGAPYMVMEFLTGSDLGQVLEQRGPLPIEQAVDYVLQACEAIAEAHSLGLVHRDLKPANLFLAARADGSSLVKVLDFGLSKATKPEAMDASLTAAHVVMGSPYYMSPEQIRSFKSIDARADIWSIGVILYQLLTGACPFDAESLGALFMAIGSDPVPSMRAVRSEIPEELEAAIVRCLVKDAKARTQTIAELARALAPFGAEDSYISVERISRVLSDNTPFSRAQSRSRSGGQSIPPGTTGEPTSQPAAAAEATAAPRPVEPVTLGSPGAASPVSAMTAASGSMAALSVNAPSSTTAGARADAAPAAPPAKSRLGVVLGAAAAVAALAVVAVLGLKGSAGSGTGAQTGAATATAEAARAAVQPAVTVTAVAAPALSAAAPVVSAGPTAAPVASTSAAPIVSARPLGGKGVASTPPASSAAPKLSRPVAAALKHGETFE